MDAPETEKPVDLSVNGLFKTVAASSGASCLSRFDEGCESRCIGDRQLGEHLAIQFDTRLVEAVNKGAVIHAVGTTGRVDADRPEPAKLALLLLAPGVRHLVGAIDCVIGGADQTTTAAVKTAGALQDALAALA